MTRIYQYGQCYILDNTDYSINLDLLGKVLNKWLKEKGEILKDNMTRCKEYGGYVIICPYGSLAGNELFDFIRLYLNVTNTIYEFEGDLPRDLVNSLAADLPKLSNYRGEQSGGGVEDTLEIDLGVKPLCDALNSYSFVQTFSSCEGHIKSGSGTLYVLFTIKGVESFRRLNKLTRVLDKSFDKVWDEIQEIKGVIFPEFLFNYGYWPGLEHIYFEIRIVYPEELKQIFFESIKRVSSLIKEGDK